MLVLVIAAVAIAVTAPLRNPERERDDGTREGRLADLELRKETKYGEIRDAESDFHAGKLSEDDYRELDRTLRREAIGILEQIDRVNREPPEEAAREGGRPS